VVSSDTTGKVEYESHQTRAIEVAIIDGLDRGLSLIVPNGGIRIGTAASCQLKVRDPTVSRIHCELSVLRGGVRVMDAGSTNGTWLEGSRVRDADLTPGAIFRIGATAIRIQSGDELVEMPISDRAKLGDLVGSSLEMRRVYALIERVAPTESTALVQGDTGTGKELVARALHEYSQRRNAPFVCVDCGAIAPNVIESELFGHVRGAFSGAVADRKGLIEEAQGGTLFLDEIGELSLTLQAKLLRALETREIRRVGENATRHVDVRVIAATNRPLARAVNEGNFRDDLYYRLAVVEFRLPPLHSRRVDIPQLAQHFYAQMTQSGAELPEELLSALLTRSWPGNVRELRNFIERCVAVGLHGSAATRKSSGRTLIRGLEALVPTHLPLREARRAWMEQFETAYIGAQLERTGGNVTRAADLCGVSRRFFQRTVARSGLRAIESDSPEPHSALAKRPPR
jgi:transcriptional regulator with PAS, ATPase and Fis domain